MTLDIMRLLRLAIHHDQVESVELLSTEVAFQVQNRKRRLDNLEQRTAGASFSARMTISGPTSTPSSASTTAAGHSHRGTPSSRGLVVDTRTRGKINLPVETKYGARRSRMCSAGCRRKSR
jgi:hypothetical protein